MQANMLKREILQRKTIYDGAVEASVVSDIVLPEHLGDIERILKCTLTPRLSSKLVEGNRLCLQGSGLLRMVYKTPEGNLESFETMAPFSKNIELASTLDNMSTTVNLCTEFCSCRAVSPRRFEMNAGVKIKAKVCALEKSMLCVGAQEDNIEFKQKELDAIIPVCCSCENFTVMEEYELSTAGVKSVLKTTATPGISEYKIVSGKLILKGNVDFCITYIADGADEPTRVSYAIPVSHVLSTPGAEETDEAEVKLSICRISVESEKKGERGEITVEMFLEACAEISRRDRVTMVLDAYCVGFDSKCTHQNVSLTTFEKSLEKNHTVSVPIDTDGGEMLDAFTEIKNSSARVNEQGEIMMTADALVSVLCKNQEGEFFLIEKSAPIEFSLAAEPELAFCDLDSDLELASVVPNKNSVALTLKALCTATKKQSLPMVTEVEVLSDSPRRINPKTALTIYFASKGEDTFDIAKRYNTSNREIMLQNSLSDTLIPEDTTILIPMTR